jgi:hypothetical protein
VVEVVSGQVLHLDERRPRHGSGIDGRKQPDGIPPDLHCWERIQSPERRAVAADDPGDKSM